MIATGTRCHRSPGHSRALGQPSDRARHSPTDPGERYLCRGGGSDPRIFMTCSVWKLPTERPSEACPASVHRPRSRSLEGRWNLITAPPVHPWMMSAISSCRVTRWPTPSYSIDQHLSGFDAADLDVVRRRGRRESVPSPQRLVTSSSSLGKYTGTSDARFPDHRRGALCMQAVFAVKSSLEEVVLRPVLFPSRHDEEIRLTRHVKRIDVLELC